MPSESIDILIKADDQASHKIQSSASKMADLGERVRDVGGKTKVTTELIGTFANTLGGTAFGHFAGELGQLTDRVAAFSQVSKAGGAGALALRAGIYAAAAVATYKIADAIGGWYFQAAKWRREMELADKAAAKASQSLAKVRDKGFQQGREDVELIRDPGQRDQAAQARATELDSQAASLDEKIKQQRRRLADAQAEADNAILPFGNQGAEAAVKAEQQLLDDLMSMQEAYRDEADAMREAHGERAKRIAQIKEDNALAQKSQDFLASLRQQNEALSADKALGGTDDQRAEIEARRSANAADLEQAKQLILERNRLQKAIEDANKESNKKENAAVLEKEELSRLEEKKILINEGTEAAKAYRLQQQGLTAEAAKELAAREAALDSLSAFNNFQKPENQAFESRTLTRGPSDNIQQKMLDEAKKQTEEQKKSNGYLSRLPLSSGSLQVQVVQ